MSRGFAVSAFALSLRGITLSRIMRQHPHSAALFLAVAISISACGSNNPSRPREPGWTPLGLEGHWALELELERPNLYACAADEGLFRKRLNRGDTQWEYVGLADTSIADAPFGHKMNRGVQDVFVLDDGTILTAVYSGRYDVPSLFRSTDDGWSWTRSDMGLDSTYLPLDGMTKLAKSPREGSAIFATCGLSIFRSEDSGSTWDTVWWNGPGGPGLDDIQVHPNRCDHVWGAGKAPNEMPFAIRSTDNGQTWNGIGGLSSLEYGNEIYRIALNPYDAKELYFSAIGKVLKTVDGGITWETIGLPISPSAPVEAMVMNERNPEHLFIAAGDVLYQSWDGCESLESVTLPADGVGVIMDMEYDPWGSTLYVGTDGGVFLYRLPQ